MHIRINTQTEDLVSTMPLTPITCNLFFFNRLHIGSVGTIYFIMDNSQKFVKLVAISEQKKRNSDETYLKGMVQELVSTPHALAIAQAMQTTLPIIGDPIGTPLMGKMSDYTVGQVIAGHVESFNVEERSFNGHAFTKSRCFVPATIAEQDVLAYCLKADANMRTSEARSIALAKELTGSDEEGSEETVTDAPAVSKTSMRLEVQKATGKTAKEVKALSDAELAEEFEKTLS